MVVRQRIGNREQAHASVRLLKTFSDSAGRIAAPMRRVVSILFRQFSSRKRRNTLMATRSTPPAAPSSSSYLVPFIIVTALFGIFGFLTNLNSNLSKELEDIFQLNHAWSNLVTTSWFFAYLVFSVPRASSSRPWATSAPWSSRCSSWWPGRSCLFPPPAWSASRSFLPRALCWHPASARCRPRPILTFRSSARSTPPPRG